MVRIFWGQRPYQAYEKVEESDDSKPARSERGASPRRSCIRCLCIWFGCLFLLSVVLVVVAKFWPLPIPNVNDNIDQLNDIEAMDESKYAKFFARGDRNTSESISDMLDNNQTDAGEMDDNDEAFSSSSSTAIVTTTGLDSRYWFNRDKPGMDPETPGRHTIWNHYLGPDIVRPKSAFTHPQFAFIKGLKVGGTTVAVALDHAARQYNIKLQWRMTEKANSNAFLPVEMSPCADGGALWFHHGYKHAWMDKCIKQVRFITMLREPVSQALSMESMFINHQYYLRYPAWHCPQKRFVRIDSGFPPSTLRRLLAAVHECVDTPYRKNITFQLVADEVRKWPSPQGDQNGYPGPAVSLTANWILGKRQSYNKMTSKALIDQLKSQYFLVGVVERMNEFLVLLAVHMGWDPASLYYITCKPTDLDVHRKEFKNFFPELEAKIEQSARPSREAYEYFKKEFDDHVAKLGPWFKEKVREFDEGLKTYQRRHVRFKEYRWAYYTYKDGHIEDC